MIEAKVEQLGGIAVDDATDQIIGEDDIRRVEQHIGGPLPSDYREFLARYGSGHFYFKRLVEIPIATYAGGVCGINSFFGAIPVKNARCYGLIDFYDQTREELPQNLLPIADDGGGSYFCISLSGDDTGWVYFWNHEEVMEREIEPSYKFVELIAQSFNEFIDRLQISPNENAFRDLQQSEL